MTYEEAIERNQRNEVDEELIPFMEEIVAECGHDLDLDKDGDLIDTAAEKMMIAEIEGQPIAAGEALRLAREEEKNRPQHEAMLNEIGKHLEEIEKLRGIEPLSRSALLSMILNQPDEPAEDTAPKLDPVYARESIKSMAESLRSEPCLYDIHYFHDNGLWQAIVRFTAGSLSADAQSALIQMKHNAHRTMLNLNKNLQVVTFIVTG